MWLVILIVVILLLRAIATSKTAANVPMQTKTVCSSPTAGDSFTQGNTIAAGVPEPPPSSIHCQHISRGPIVYSGLPIHIVYPVAPPPIKITNPVAPAPAPISPKFQPPTPIRSYPIPTSPKILMSTCFCNLGTCGGGYGGGGGGGGGSCGVVSHGELAGGDIGYF